MFENFCSNNNNFFFRDIVKLTALLVARNGRQFLNQLMNREQKNYQFDFLRPQHSLFQYFTKLLDQYTKVLIPPKNIRDRLSHETKEDILENIKYRAEWFKYQDAQRRKEEEIQEKERSKCLIIFTRLKWYKLNFSKCSENHICLL